MVSPSVISTKSYLNTVRVVGRTQLHQQRHIYGSELSIFPSIVQFPLPIHMVGVQSDTWHHGSLEKY